MKFKHLATLLIGVLMIGLVSCEYQTIEPNPVTVPETPVDFAAQIEPLFTQWNCVSCHTAAQNPNLTVGQAYNSLITLHLVDTLNPASSVLLRKINGGHQTPAGMTDAQKALLVKWISQGAKGVITKTSFSAEVEPIFTALNCINCHGGSNTPDLRATKAYASLTGNNLVVSKNPSGSKLIQYINAGHNTAAGMSAAQKATIIKWINEGILNN